MKSKLVCKKEFSTQALLKVLGAHVTQELKPKRLLEAQEQGKSLRFELKHNIVLVANVVTSIDMVLEVYALEKEDKDECPDT